MLRRYLLVSLGLLGLLAPRAQAGIWEDIAALRQRVDSLLAGGKPAEAVAAAEGFIRDHPKGPGMDALIEIAGGAIEKGYPKPADRVAQAERAMAAFAAVPLYYAKAAHLANHQRLWGSDPAVRDDAAVDKTCQTALELIGDQLPKDSYLLVWLYGDRMHALRRQGKGRDALWLAKDAVAFAPRMLGDPSFLGVYREMAAAGSPDDRLRAAALTYRLCDYTEPAIKAALDAVSTALTATSGPGAGLRFVKAQEDPKLDNPLKGVALPDLGPAAELLAAAGDDLQSQLCVHLYAGDVAAALAVAKQQMAKAAGQDAKALAGPLRNLARCFKAHDLHLVRANAFLEYHRSGEGDDPLPGLEKELAAEAGAKE
jgi:hypothetical protein